MKLTERLRRLDDVVLARLGFIDRPLRFAQGGYVPGPVTVHLYPGEKIIGPEEMARLVARHLAIAEVRGARPIR